MRRLPTLGLLLVSLIWGTTFVAVKSSMAHSSPFLFVGLRFLLAAIAALPLLPRRNARLRPAFLASIPLGLILAGSYSTQTIGLTIASPARSAFITGLNVALVPLWILALRGKAPGKFALAGVMLCVPGLWLLTSPEGSHWNRGDSWTLACAVLYALYVVLVNRAAERFTPGELLFPQLLVTALACLPASLVLEAPRFAPAPGLLIALGFTALLATTGTTWLQLKCQPHVGPTRSAVLYATEPLFAALFSYLLIGERLSAPAWGGAALILAGMLLAELDGRRS